MHWADVIAKELMAKNAKNLISTGHHPIGLHPRGKPERGGDR